MGRLPRARGLVARHITLLCALALLLATAGCGGQRQLHIALHPWIGYETLTLAADLDWLPPSVVLQRGASVSDSLQALREGRVQAAAVTLDEALRLCAELPSLQVVLVMDESAGADALVANPAIEDLAALAGRRVAYEDSAVTKLLLHGALARAGLLPGDIEGVDLTVDRHLPAYREGRIDASVSYQPHTQDLLAAGAVRLFDSRDLPGMILDVLVVDSRALGRRRALLRQVVAAHFRALRYLRSSPDDAVYRIAGYQGRSAAAIRRALEGARLPGVEAVRELLAGSAAVAGAVERFGELGIIAQSPALGEFLNADFLPPPAPP